MNQQENITEGRKMALRVIKSCVKPVGFYASGLVGGYDAVWTRDSMMIALGASLLGKKFQTPFRKSLELLSKYQSRLGQIPNAVGSYNTDRRSSITYNTIDSTIWYLIGHHAYAKAYQSKILIKKYKHNIARAIIWLSYQDPNETLLLAQQPTMDWQDAFPHKYGHVLSTQALYYAALKFYGKKKEARHIQRIVNGEIQKYLSLYDEKRGYYLPWIWKNHDGDREQATWFDTFGNLFAIVSGLATPQMAGRILRFMEKRNIHRPYPCKAIFPPLQKDQSEWHSYFSKSDAKKPYHYLNAGVWPFLGGWFVAALTKVKKISQAQSELDRLTQAVKLHKKGIWGFHEWLEGRSGKPIGNSNPYQGWTAGMYIFACECVRRKEVPYFDWV